MSKFGGSIWGKRPNITIFKEGDNKVKTYRKYEDTCILCNRKLIGDSNKLFWTPKKIRQYKKDFLGKMRRYTIIGKKFVEEQGTYVCRASNKCIGERKNERY